MRKILNFLRGRVVGMHHDDRGVVSVLAVLTVWCMVALLGMLFNEVEESRRKAQMQAAADAAAYSASVWMARASNQAVAYNMSLAQDVSMESIWASIAATDHGMHDRLNHELDLLDDMEKHPVPFQPPRNVLDPWMLLAEVAGCSGHTNQALLALEAGNGANFTGPAERQAYENSYRQARSAFDWVWFTYVLGPVDEGGVTLTVPGGMPGGGAPPAKGAPGRPGGPGPGGQGIMYLLSHAVMGSVGPQVPDEQIIAYIRNYIRDVELARAVPAFEKQTASVLTVDVAGKVAQHEAELYQQCLAELAEVPGGNPGHANAVREQLESVYNAGLTYANLDNVHGRGGPADVTVPFMPASDLPAVSHTDSIREKYADQLPAGMDKVVQIDPMNPQTDEARVWHPGLIVDIGETYQELYGLKANYPVSGDIPLGWGHLYAWPIERYARERAAMDRAELDQRYLQWLDRLRNLELGAKVAEMSGTGYAPQYIMELPAWLADDQPVPGTALFGTIPVFPHVTAPPRANADFRAQVADFNYWSNRLAMTLVALREELINHQVGRYAYFTEGFASELWRENVSISLEATLAKAGREKKFVVLKSAALHEVPQWAQGTLQADAIGRVESQVLRMSIEPLRHAIHASMVANDPDGYGAGIEDPDYLNYWLNRQYGEPANDVATMMLQPAAQQIASEIVAEWMSRPWPYEIAPPEDDRYPMPQGVLPPDRKKYFTVVAAARESAASHPQTILPAFFKPSRTALIAFAQAETFNWMEFNGDFGARDPLDQTRTISETVYLLPSGIYSEVVPIPAAWRVATVGGWQYRARLSLADTLTYEPDDASMNVFDKNDELREYFESAGIKPTEKGVPNDVNLH